MNITAIENQEYLLEENGKRLILSFISDSAFRLREVDAPSSFATSAYIPNNEGVIIENDEKSVRVGRRALLLEFREGFLLRVLNNGKVMLNQVPFALDHGEFDYASTIKEKEGHSVYKPSSLVFGLSFENNDPVYGLGDKTGPLDKRGYDYINYNSDIPQAHTDGMKSLYKSVNFFIVHHGENDVGVFLDNTYETHFDFNKSDEKLVSFGAVGGKLDVYFFFGELKDVVAAYSELTGRNPLPPRWGFGILQSRWSYPSKEAVDNVISGYKENDLPLSGVFLDIDYMDSYKDFTVNEERFPFFDFWVDKKRKEGVRIVPIIDAGVKAESGYSVYDSGVMGNHFCKLGNEIYHNEVWPGDSVFPSFVDKSTQEWWADLVANFLKTTGVTAIWNDMNEPASFNGPLPDEVDVGGISHKEGHNIYAHCMNKASYDGFIKAGVRPFIITRAAYSGTQRYACSWTGDNQSLYDHLRLAIPQVCNMSLSGFTFTGCDIGGFGADTTPELFARWSISSLFNPLYRNHSSIGTKAQEPYALGEMALKAFKLAADIRMQILPTLYDQFFLHERRGSIPVRPLVYNYPLDRRTWNENTELMLGDSLLLAPALFPGQTKRSVYFPDVFFDFFTGKRYEPGDYVIDVSTENVPLFVRQNSLVVLNPQGTKTSEYSDTLRLLWTGGEATVTHYEDEGEGLEYKNGKYNLRLISISADGEMKRTYLHEGMPSKYKEIKIELLGGPSRVEKR